VRTWIALSVTSFAAGALYCLIVGENSVATDDPYIVGLAVALPTSGCALLLAVAQACGISSVNRRRSYFALLLALITFWVAGDLLIPSHEGRGLGSIMAIACGISACLAYALHVVRLTTWYILLASIPGIVYLIGYLSLFASWQAP
jgi:hypothetical protein